MKRLIFTVTNDLAYDQRMIRICNSLASAGYDVLLVGRSYKDSPKLTQRAFRQKRLPLLFRKGILFYTEYNVRLFFFLLFRRADLICAIDLDTILPVFLASKIKGTKKVYDAHELFCEMKEVVSRPAIFKIWKWIEKNTVPRFKSGYTVNEPIRDIFMKDYGVQYEVIRNIPVLVDIVAEATPEHFIIYQGAVNEGRAFENLIPAFKYINCPLHIYGDGNFLDAAKSLVAAHHLDDKVLFKGKLEPEALRKVTPKAKMGITLFENKGLSNYYSLANRFFDYFHAGIPQLCVDYPVYRSINQQFEVAVLVNDLSPENIAASINVFLLDEDAQQRIRTNCAAALKQLNWQAEEQKLIQFYKQLLG